MLKHTKIRYHIGLFAVLLGLTACSEQESPEQIQDSGFTITLTENTETSDSRATPAEIGKPVVEEFNLKILNQATDQTIYDDKFTEKHIPAPAGIYSIIASHGENPELAYDTPYYNGMETAEVITKETTNVTVKCKVANALTSIIFEDKAKFDELYSNYEVTVTIGQNMLSLIGDGRSAYYKAGSKPIFTFKGILKGNSKPVEHVLKNEILDNPDSFTAASHCKITLKVKPTTPGLVPDISKVEIEEVTVSETIPVEWLPKPKIESEDFDETNTLSFAETTDIPASIKITTSSALQDLKLKFHFEDEQFASLNDKAEGYLLSNPEDKAKIEETLGIILPAIGDKSAIIDWTPLIPHIQTKSGETVRNTIELDAKANGRWSSENETANRVYTLTCTKPEFTLSVLPGNIWSKEFTVDECNITSGNAETIKKQLIYQYKDKSANEEGWQNIENMKVLFANHPENKQYQVRAVYRNAITSNVVDIELETPTQLPNSDMEEWSIEEKKKEGTWPFKPKTYYTFHPHTKEAGNSSWWDTNNDKAQGGTYALGIWYEGCFASCVSYTEDTHGGTKAALIYLSGCGDGYANTGSTYVGGAMVGSLFIGKYDSGIVQGHNFDSRPTSLSFWYKYKPYNSDAFKVVMSLKNGDKEIATGVYEPTDYSTEDSEYKQAKIDLTYIDNHTKATTICVQFLASNKTELTQDNFAKGTTITYPVVGNWTVHMGSILKIDDLSLVYDK